MVVWRFDYVNSHKKKEKKTLITSALNQVGISEITDIAALCFPVREHRLWLRLRVIQARSLISRLSGQIASLSNSKPSSWCHLSGITRRREREQKTSQEEGGNAGSDTYRKPPNRPKAEAFSMIWVDVPGKNTRLNKVSYIKVSMPPKSPEPHFKGIVGSCIAEQWLYGDAWTISRSAREHTAIAACASEEGINIDNCWGIQASVLMNNEGRKPRAMQASFSSCRDFVT
jgi:hypothetical protein